MVKRCRPDSVLQRRQRKWITARAATGSRHGGSALVIFCAEALVRVERGNAANEAANALPVAAAHRTTVPPSKDFLGVDPPPLGRGSTILSAAFETKESVGVAVGVAAAGTSPRPTAITTASSGMAASTSLPAVHQQQATISEPTDS